MYTHCCNRVLNLVISASSQLPVIRNAMETTVYRTYAFSVAFCTARIDISRQYWKRSLRLGFFATEAETNLHHTLGRKTWVGHHFPDTIASSCFYTWGIVAGKQVSGGCDRSSNFAGFCREMHVFNRGFSYATHFWYNPACFKTAKERMGYICSDWAQWWLVVKLAGRAAKFHLWLQARRQDLAAVDAKNQMKGKKNRRGATFLKYSIECMQQPGG